MNPEIFQQFLEWARNNGINIGGQSVPTGVPTNMGPPQLPAAAQNAPPPANLGSTILRTISSIGSTIGSFFGL